VITAYEKPASPCHIMLSKETIIIDNVNNGKPAKNAHQSANSISKPEERGTK